MLLRDLTRWVNKLRGREADEAPGVLAKSPAVTEAHDERGRRQDHSFLYRPSVGKVGGVWGYDGTQIFQYNDAGDKIINRAVGASYENKSFVHFRESSDGWLYGFFGDATKLERWLVTASSITRETLITGITGLTLTESGYEPFGDLSDKMLVGPDGTVYVMFGKIVDWTASSGPWFDDTRRYRRLRNNGGTWQFDDPAETAYQPLCFSSGSVGWDNMKRHGGGGGFAQYSFRNPVSSDCPRAFKLRRYMKGAISAGGTWVAADPIPYWGIYKASSVTVFEFDDHGEYEMTEPADVFPVTHLQDTETMMAVARTWGNAWWKRSGYDQAWVTTQNGGISSGAIEVVGRGNSTVESSTRFGEVGASGSVHKTIRESRVVTQVLPHVLRSHPFWWSSGTVQPDNTDVPHQAFKAMLVDKSSAYLFGGLPLLIGQEAVSTQVDPLNLYKASYGVDGPGSWTEIVTLPFSFGGGSGAVNTQCFAVSATRLWVVELDGGAPFSERDIRIYDKSGVLKRTINDEPSSSIPAAPRSLCLTAVFKGRWA